MIQLKNYLTQSGSVMKKLFFSLFLIILSSACSVEEESTVSVDEGTSEGTYSSPLELTVGTAKTGTVGRTVRSYYKFTTASTGAGNYKFVISSMSISDPEVGNGSLGISLYDDSSYSGSSYIDSETWAVDGTKYFDYKNLNNNKYYYFTTSGNGAVSYTLTVSKGSSEGSKSDPVELTLGTAHSGTITNYYYTTSQPVWRAYSYYKFTTSAEDNYTLTMTNSDSLDCQLYLNSGFSTYWQYYNNCTEGTNLSTIFRGSAYGLSANTAYYLKIWGSSTTAKTTTYDNMTVAPEG